MARKLRVLVWDGENYSYQSFMLTSAGRLLLPGDAIEIGHQPEFIPAGLLVWICQETFHRTAKLLSYLPISQGRIQVPRQVQTFRDAEMEGPFAGPKRIRKCGKGRWSRTAVAHWGRSRPTSSNTTNYSLADSLIKHNKAINNPGSCNLLL